MNIDKYLKEPISNGQPREQALIRKWWHEKKNGQGVLVWEYCLEGLFLDAVWLDRREPPGTEQPGLKAPLKYPLKGQEIILCEAKVTLTPELVGQALVYKQFAIHAGASVKEVIIFCEKATESMFNAAKELGLTVEVLRSGITSTLN